VMLAVENQVNDSGDLQEMEKISAIGKIVNEKKLMYFITPQNEERTIQYGIYQVIDQYNQKIENSKTAVIFIPVNLGEWFGVEDNDITVQILGEKESDNTVAERLSNPFKKIFMDVAEWSIHEGIDNLSRTDKVVEVAKNQGLEAVEGEWDVISIPKTMSVMRKRPDGRVFGIKQK